MLGSVTLAFAWLGEVRLAPAVCRAMGLGAAAPEEAAASAGIEPLREDA